MIMAFLHIPTNRAVQSLLILDEPQRLEELVWLLVYSQKPKLHVKSRFGVCLTETPDRCRIQNHNSCVLHT